MKKKNLSKSTCPTGSFTCPGPSGSGKLWTLNLVQYYKILSKSLQELWQNINQGGVSIRKTVLPGMAIPMLKIRRPNGRLIFNMEIALRR